MTEESKDCLQCRLTSGGGLLAAGTYVVYHSKKVKTFSRHIITAIGCGLSVLGMLRILALPPFKSHSQDKEKCLVEENDENEYIIGKFPPKFH